MAETARRSVMLFCTARIAAPKLSSTWSLASPTANTPVRISIDGVAPENEVTWALTYAFAATTPAVMVDALVASKLSKAATGSDASARATTKSGNGVTFTRPALLAKLYRVMAGVPPVALSMQGKRWPPDRLKVNEPSAAAVPDTSGPAIHRAVTDAPARAHRLPPRH